MVALGDSFIAGEGAKRYLEGTSDEANTCHRANTSYPYVVAADRQYRLLAIACSGAVTDDIDRRGQHPDSPADIPGGLPQIKLMDSSPLHDSVDDIDFVVLSIGGNDAGFGDIVNTCLNERKCQRHDREWMARLNQIGPKLDRVYREIAEKAPDARRIIMTYPQILVPGTCVPSLEPAEIRWVNLRFLPRLFAIIDFVGTSDGFEVVDNSAAFVGARICEDGIRVKGRAANIFSTSDVRGDISPAELLRGSFHPTPIGHELLAAQLDHQLNAIASSPTPCGDNCPPTPPPGPDGPPPGTTSSFPTGTACVGDEVSSDGVLTTPARSTFVDVPAIPGSTYCYRDWEGEWMSGTATAAGQVHLSTQHLRSGAATSIELIAQSAQTQTPVQGPNSGPSSGTWVRTVVITPVGDTIGVASPLETFFAWIVAFGIFAFVLALLPWLLTWWQTHVGTSD